MQIELTKNQALTLATLSAFNSREKWTPVLTETLVTIADNKLTAMATDRFAAVKFTDDVIADDVEFRLTPNLSKFLKTNLVKAYRNQVWIDVADNGAVTIRLSEGAALTETPSTGKFPAVNTLFESWQPATAAMATAYAIEKLARLEKIKLDGEFADLWHLESGVNPNGNTNRPGPTLATSAKDDRLVALVQPNLLVKEKN